MHFFSVTKFDKTKYIPRNVEKMKKLYPNFQYSVIVPGTELNLFKKYFLEMSIDEIEIIDESSYLSLKEFKSILKQYIKYKKDMPSKTVLGWYFQLVLKIAHVIKKGVSKSITMIDSDTVILKKLNLFLDNHSIVYKTNYERNIHYKKSCEDLFDTSLKNWESFTVQIFSITKQESVDLRSRLSKYMNQNSMNDGEWISHILLNSIFKRHLTLNGSFMSEQDLIGISNVLSGSKIDRSLKILRSFVIGELSPMQENIAALFGYSFINYEKWIMKKEKMNYLDFIIAMVINNHFFHKFLKKIQVIIKFIKNF